jgi:hypothetical protein
MQFVPHTGLVHRLKLQGLFPEAQVIKADTRGHFLSRFSYCSKFDNHGKTPSIHVIEILLTVRDSAVNLRPHFEPRQSHCFDTRADGIIWDSQQSNWADQLGKSNGPWLIVARM